VRMLYMMFVLLLLFVAVVALIACLELCPWFLVMAEFVFLAALCVLPFTPRIRAWARRRLYSR